MIRIQPRRVPMLVGSLLLAIVFSLQLSAQRTSGTISGVVTDPTGAVVPIAKVVATNTGTGTTTNVDTNTTGFYVISNLEPGNYQLSVDAKGFQRYERRGIALQAGGDLTVNVSIAVGTSTQTITVTGEADLVNTREQTIATSITPQFTEQLPLNGRNILDLMQVAPDAVLHAGGPNLANQQATRPDSVSGFVTASGASRENSTAFYLNGGLDMDTYTQVANIFPNPDAIQEFTFETNSSSAKYGGMGGGIVNAVTRSGSNHVHGSAFEYVRNGDLNARNFFSTGSDTLKRNQFGGSLGAPIQKDKTFVFFSFQRTTLRYGSSSGVAYGPTAAEMAGNWSDIGHQLYDDRLGNNTFSVTGGVPFQGNQVPVSAYNPIALKVLKLVQQGDPLTGRITYTKTSLTNDNQFVGRVDRNFGDKLRIYGSILQDTYTSPSTEDPNNAITHSASTSFPSIHAALNATYIFDPNLVTTVGLTASRVLVRDLGTHAFPSVSSLGANFPNWLPQGEEESGGYFGWFGWGQNDHYNVSRNQYDFTNNWTYTRGNHMLEFGGELALSQSVLNQDFWGQGYTYNSCNWSGNSGLDFLIGQNCAYEQFYGFYNDNRGKAPAMYVTDKWRVSPRLTLNLGVRWEPFLPWVDNSAVHIGNYFDPAAFAAGTHSQRYPNLPPGLLVHGDPGVPAGLAPNDWKLFDPRVGLAWDVRGNGKTSIRAGFGIYHDQPFGRMYNAMNQTPFVAGNSWQDGTVPWWDPYQSSPYNGVPPVALAQNPSNTVFPSPFGSVVAFSSSFKPPATAQWNFTIEHQMGQGFLVRASYQGSESYHMFDSRNINAAMDSPGTATGANVNQRRPLYPAFGGAVVVNETTATSSFNSLNLSVEKRMTGNLSLLGGYRWAKCLDTGMEGASASFINYYTFQDNYNTRLDRGNCDSDVASQVKMTAIYRLPTLRSWGFVGRNILGGWTASAMWTWHDGLPLTFWASQDANQDGFNYDRAQLVGNLSLPGNRSTAAKLNEWFNTAAITNPAPGTEPNSARNIMRGPGSFNLDCSMIKSFPISFGPLKETQKVDFRAEFFNVLNHPNFGGPDTNVNSWTEGQINWASDPRVLQFALKYIF